MLRLKDPNLGERPAPRGTELPAPDEQESLDRFDRQRSSVGQPPAMSALVESRVVLKAVKHEKRFDWAGSRSALPAIIRQMEKYGWAVTVREEVPRDHA